MKKNGFTLIELIIVILLIGILSAVVVPRFMNISQDAQDANISATANALGSALHLAHSKWLAIGQPEINLEVSDKSFLSWGKNRIGFNAQGWPVAIWPQTRALQKGDILGNSTQSDALCAKLVTTLLNASSDMFGASQTCVQKYCVTYQQDRCIFHFQESTTNKKIIYDHNTGKVTWE